MTDHPSTAASSGTDPRWLALYHAGIDPTPTIKYDSALRAWDQRITDNPDGVALRYFDGTLTAGDLDGHADALATEFHHRGVGRGDRIGIHLQNIPHYLITLLAVWKVGATAVPLNPMYRNRELRRLVDDAGVSGMVVTRGTDAETRESLAGSTVRWLISASGRDFQSRNDPRVFSQDDNDTPSPDGDVADVLRSREGQAPHPTPIGLDDIAFITYTSGTTGPPKGALNTHRNYLHSVGNYGAWLLLRPGDVVHAIAPLFHITGLSLNAGIALLNDATLSLAGRFHAAVAVEAFRDHAVTTTVGSITAFNAFFGVDDAGPEHFHTVRILYSGGAPIPPSTINAFRDRFGPYLHNIWGMTETTGGGIAVPAGATAPVHGPSGTLSIGVPMQNADVRIVDPTGAQLPPGFEGELVFRAPQVIPGYWHNAEATEHTLPAGNLHTGDVAIMDQDGWFYLVDRIKDQINTSGFKVWPREVEDTLYEHPAVFEAAVIGEPDPYRGEAVVAYVSLHPGMRATSAELIAFARQRLAAYKAPRRVTIVAAVPKTATGKIQRAALRDGRAGAP